MRGPFLLRTPSAALSLSAALFLASCAAPPTVPPGGKPPQGVSSVDGANVEYAAFHNSAFPYRGVIPNYQETGKTRPFLDVDDNGRLGHSSPRGGLLWEDQTYNDRTVLLAAPQSFNPGRPGVIIVFFSGGYLPAVYSLTVGGEGGRVRGVVLLDALYGEKDKFVRWAEGPGRSAFFVSAYSTSSRDGN